MAFINAAHIGSDEFEDIVKDMLPNVHIYRVKNSWTTVDKMKQVLGLLKKVVQEKRHRFEFCCVLTHTKPTFRMPSSCVQRSMASFILQCLPR